MAMELLNLARSYVLMPSTFDSDSWPGLLVGQLSCHVTFGGKHPLYGELVGVVSEIIIEKAL